MPRLPSAAHPKQRGRMPIGLAHPLHLSNGDVRTRTPDLKLRVVGCIMQNSPWIQKHPHVRVVPQNSCGNTERGPPSRQMLRILKTFPFQILNSVPMLETAAHFESFLVTPGSQKQGLSGAWGSSKEGCIGSTEERHFDKLLPMHNHKQNGRHFNTDPSKRNQTGDIPIRQLPFLVVDQVG